MLNRAKKQGPKTFCAMFQVAWDLTWLGCEGMKKNRHTHSEDGIQWPVLALSEGTKYTIQSLVCLLCTAQRESAPWVGGKEAFVSFL